MTVVRTSHQWRGDIVFNNVHRTPLSENWETNTTRCARTCEGGDAQSETHAATRMHSQRGCTPLLPTKAFVTQNGFPQETALHFPTECAQPPVQRLLLCRLR